jgi:hypothetical protein
MASSQGLIHGRTYRKELENPAWWQKLLGIKYEPGHYFEMAHLDRGAALYAFDAFIADPGDFSIEASFGGKMEFHARRGDSLITIECWFFDSNLDQVDLSASSARKLVEFLYTHSSEAEVIRFLAAEGAKTSPEHIA